MAKKTISVYESDGVELSVKPLPRGVTLAVDGRLINLGMPDLRELTAELQEIIRKHDDEELPF